MNEQNQRDSIMSMARGAFEERVDYEMDKVIQNILDPNTKATAKRKITLTIELRSLCIPNEGTAYLLDLLSRMTNENSVSTNDNGVTQTVEARQGVALNALVEIKPRVMLRPFRTFLEVEQPESEFLLRVDPDEGIGFFEADGGIWKLEAKKFLSTPSARRATTAYPAGEVTKQISIHALREEGDHR